MMSRLVGGLAVVLTVILWSGSNPVRTQAAPPVDTNPPSNRFASGQILVKFRYGIDSGAGRLMAFAADAAPAPKIDALQVQRFSVPAGKEIEYVEKFQASPLVEYAELDYLVSTTVQPNDPFVRNNYEWYLDKVDAPAAWDVTTGGDNSVTIAIVDTGIDGTHPDLKGRVVAGYDFVARRPLAAGAASDDFYHGTHVAGIAGATGNNGIGGSGLSWSASLMPVKVLGADGSGTYSDLSEGIIWAVDRGARIVNLSLGDPAPEARDLRTLKDAVQYAQKKDALVVAAAGNEAFTGNPVEYPAAIEGVLAVGATDETDQRAGFSNYQPYVGISAPGVGMYSTSPGGGYRTLSGTSMATPVVSGIAALLLSAYPSLTADQVKDRLQSTALDLGAPGRDVEYGFGRVSAARALLTDAVSVDRTKVTIVTNGRAAGTATVSVQSRVPGAINWQARSSDGWLKIAGSLASQGIASGKTSEQLVLTIDPRALPSGTAKGKIQVGPVVGQDLLSPQTIEVEVVQGEVALSRVFFPGLSRDSLPLWAP